MLKKRKRYTWIVAKVEKRGLCLPENRRDFIDREITNN